MFVKSFLAAEKRATDRLAAPALQNKKGRTHFFAVRPALYQFVYFFRFLNIFSSHHQQLNAVLSDSGRYLGIFRQCTDLVGDGRVVGQGGC